MKPRILRYWLIILAACLAVSSPAQTNVDVPTLPDLIQGAQLWARQNLDTNPAALIDQIDPAAANDFYRDFLKRLKGDNVVDLAAVRDTAEAYLPLLQSHAETQPFASWLKAQMDYLDVAEEIRLAAQPPPIPANAPPPKPARPAPVVIPNPPPQMERQIWVRQETRRPYPPGAEACAAELKPIFAARKVPPELVWVAEVESSFDSNAESPVGAAGLFQLMPDTAKRFGLSLWPRDQRYQPVPSATASADYFKYLYGKFHDWRLAMAAYNSGEGTVQRLLKRRQARTFDEIAGHLPAETQMYVPRVEAVILEREGVRMEELPGPAGEK